MCVIEEYRVTFLIVDIVTLTILFSLYLISLVASIYPFVPRPDKYPGGPEI